MHIEMSHSSCFMALLDGTFIFQWDGSFVWDWLKVHDINAYHLYCIELLPFRTLPFRPAASLQEPCTAWEAAADVYLPI